MTTAKTLAGGIMRLHRTHVLLGAIAAILLGSGSVLPDVALAGDCGNPRFTVCPPSMTIYACDTPNGPKAVLSYPTPTAINDCGPIQTFRDAGPDSGTALPPGDYDVVWMTREDENFNFTTCFFTVRVIWRPEIECPRDTLVRACDPYGANVNYPLPTAFDDCGPIPVFLAEGPPPGGFFPIGTTQVEYRTNEDNHGSYRDCRFYVTVEWPRTMTACPEDTTVYVCPTEQGAYVNYTLPQAFDDCGPIEVIPSDDTPPPGGFFEVGTTHMDFRTQYDSDGRALYCSFHVRVEPRDEEPPTLTCPTAISAVVDPGQTTAVVTWESEATDNCPGSIEIECHPPSGSVFPCGTTAVTCIATDYNDNVSQCTFDVNVGIPVSVDVRPGMCPNPFKMSELGLVPVAIYGTRSFNVSDIDPASVRLEGIAPVRTTLQDVGSPYEPYVGKDGCVDCASTKKDRIKDLSLKFDAAALAEALGTAANGECRLVSLTGLLVSGCPVVGEDVLRILTVAEVSLEPGDISSERAPTELLARHANPFSPGSRIDFALPAPGRTRLVVYDVLGRRVRVLLDQDQAAGNHSLAWDGRNDTGARATSGLYFYVLTVTPDDGSGMLVEKRRLVLSP
jgi:hypothetical protein